MGTKTVQRGQVAYAPQMHVHCSHYSRKKDSSVKKHASSTDQEATAFMPSSTIISTPHRMDSTYSAYFLRDNSTKRTVPRKKVKL